MISDIASRISEYNNLLSAIKECISEHSEVLAIFREISEDMREAYSFNKRAFKYNIYATEKQKAYLKANGSIVTKNVNLETLTKSEASELISTVNSLRVIVTDVVKQFNLF